MIGSTRARQGIRLFWLFSIFLYVSPRAACAGVPHAEFADIVPRTDFTRMLTVAPARANIQAWSDVPALSQGEIHPRFDLNSALDRVRLGLIEEELNHPPGEFLQMSPEEQDRLVDEADDIIRADLRRHIEDVQFGQSGKEGGPFFSVAVLDTKLMHFGSLLPKEEREAGVDAVISAVPTVDADDGAPDFPKRRLLARKVLLEDAVAAVKALSRQ